MAEHLGHRQKGGNGTLADIRTGAAPSIVPSCHHDTRTHRIEMDVAAEFHQVRVSLHQRRLVTPLQQVADTVMRTIERLRVSAIELAHGAAEIRLQCLDEEMVVIVHQNVRVQQEAVLPDGVGQHRQEAVTIGIATEDRLTLVAARGDVVEGAGELDSERACHTRFDRGRTAADDMCRAAELIGAATCRTCMEACRPGLRGSTLLSLLCNPPILPVHSADLRPHPTDPRRVPGAGSGLDSRPLKDACRSQANRVRAQVQT